MSRNEGLQSRMWIMVVKRKGLMRKIMKAKEPPWSLMGYGEESDDGTLQCWHNLLTSPMRKWLSREVK